MNPSRSTTPGGWGNPPGTSGIGAAQGGLRALNNAPDQTGNALGALAVLNSASGMSAGGGGAVGGANTTPKESSGVPSGRGVTMVCMSQDELAVNRGASMPDGAHQLGGSSEGSGGQPAYCIMCVFGRLVRIFLR
jgi:hypothetical protein